MLFSYYFIFDRIKCVLVQWLFRKEDTLWCLSQRAYISLTCISGHICICYSSETNLTCFQWWCVSNWHSADISVSFVPKRTCFTTFLHWEKSSKYNTAKHLWWTLSCLEMWWNMFFSIWYIFSIETKSKEKMDKINH